MHQLEADPSQLAALDDRLHELRQQARKHGCNTSELPVIHKKLTAQLASIEDSSGTIAQLTEVAHKWRDHYHKLADELTHCRRQAARRLDAAVMTELPPLKLDGAQFDRSQPAY